MRASRDGCRSPIPAASGKRHAPAGTMFSRRGFLLRGGSRREDAMPRKYSKGASSKVERAMHERKRGTLKSGRSGKKVTSRKQAIAIGLSEARREGGKVPRKRTARKK